jgi:hypothetical protein
VKDKKQFSPTHKVIYFGSELPRRMTPEQQKAFDIRLKPVCENFVKKFDPAEVKEICAGDEVPTVYPHQADCLKFKGLFLPKS